MEQQMSGKQKRAYRLYVQYKTTSAEYKALAAELGYASSGDLNAFFARLRGQRFASAA